jgi:hypothetical protein
VITPVKSPVGDHSGTADGFASGGTNVGGPGRPPSVIRERCRGSFYQRVNVLEEIADAPDTMPGDRIRAIDVLGRYGLMTARIDLEEVKIRLSRTIAKIEELCDPDTAERLLTALDPIWNSS